MRISDWSSDVCSSDLWQAADSSTQESKDDGHQDANVEKGRLRFLLACLHGLVQERRNYIPQGWTSFYEFSYGDLKVRNKFSQDLVCRRAKADGVDRKSTRLNSSH